VTILLDDVIVSYFWLMFEGVTIKNKNCGTFGHPINFKFWESI